MLQKVNLIDAHEFFYPENISFSYFEKNKSNSIIYKSKIAYIYPLLAVYNILKMYNIIKLKRTIIWITNDSKK